MFFVLGRLFGNNGGRTMKKWMVCVAALFALWGAQADELLDAVLGLDQPVTWRSETTGNTAVTPGRAPAASPTTGKAAATDDLLDAVLDTEKPTPSPERGPAKTVPAKTVPVKPPAGKRVAAPHKGAAANTDRTPKPSVREEQLEQAVRSAEERAARAEAALRAQKSEAPLPEMTDEKEEETTDRSAGGMERSVRLSLGGGGGGDSAMAFSGEFTIPLWKSIFDLSLKGGYTRVEYTTEKSYQETYYTHYTTYSYRTVWTGWSSYSYSVPHYHTERHTRTIYYTTTDKTENFGGEAVVLLRPFRGRWLSPYAGGGVRYEKTEVDDAKEVSACGRVGARLNLGRWWLGGEFDGGKESTELIGTLGWRCWKHVALQAGVIRFEAKGTDGERHDGIVGGGGLTWVF